MKTSYLYLLLIVVSTLGACKDNCRRISCENDSYCYDGACICSKWYSGDKCQLQFNRNYEGLYTGEATQGGRSVASTITLEADKDIPNRMYFTETALYLEFETDSTFTIPEQDLVVINDTLIVYGDGMYTSDHIEFSYGQAEESEHGTTYSSVLVEFTGLREEEPVEAINR
ncbi:hypothetical protein OAA53_02255 [Salibacteraceae bacterium]|jgi:hypothetical protein|nr:hypothetical protein [Flavobacteriales bacterium]MDB9701537.1 hypothetical protein [Salibacteraceae bacterium]